MKSLVFAMLLSFVAFEGLAFEDANRGAGEESWTCEARGLSTTDAYYDGRWHIVVGKSMKTQEEAYTNAINKCGWWPGYRFCSVTKCSKTIIYPAN